MKFTKISTFVSILLVGLASKVSATALEVFVPPIVNPVAGEVWTSGQHRIVTWDTSNAPVNITNEVGFILLRKDNLITPLILAENFDIRLGQISVVVPLVVVGDDYQLVLFGDSGNFSPKFTITGSTADF